MLDMMGLDTCKLVSTPGEMLKAREATIDAELLDDDKKKLFQKVVGTAIHLSRYRADIKNAVKECARSMAAPTVGSMKKVKRLCKYLQGTRDYAEILT